MSFLRPGEAGTDLPSLWTDTAMNLMSEMNIMKKMNKMAPGLI
jgi:hypothetical protein